MAENDQLVKMPSALIVRTATLAAKTFALLLPALVPSWRFFDWIAPSPRIEFALLENETADAGQWHELRPRPAQITVARMLTRLGWNPRWNDTLYLVSCAERILETGSPHAIKEIRIRIEEAIAGNAAAFVQFRLILVSRDGETVRRDVVFISPVSGRPEGAHHGH